MLPTTSISKPVNWREQATGLIDRCTICTLLGCERALPAPCTIVCLPDPFLDND